MTQVVNVETGPFVRPWMVVSKEGWPRLVTFSTQAEALEWAEARGKALVNSEDLYVVEIRTFVEAIRTE